MNKASKYTRDYAKRLIEARAMTQRQLEHEFLEANVPRLHRALMLMFPISRLWFNYSIARNEDDVTKLTLLRGEGKKIQVLARNFNPEAL